LCRLRYCDWYQGGKMKRLIVVVTVLMLTVGFVYAEDISLTVYNNDMAVVKVLDSMSFEKGAQTISYTGVADRIDPTSVRFSVPKGGVTVLEQNYRYDLANSRTVLDRYIDKNVTLIVEQGGMVGGVLQSVAGDIVLRDESGRVNIVRLDAVERYELPGLPEGLVTRPTLYWKLDSAKAGKYDTEVSYITGGLSWHAEYTAVVGRDEKTMELSSWVSVDNNSGAAYHNARLKLIAGDVHRVVPGDMVLGRGKLMSVAEEAPQAPGFVERGLFEYHLYDLQRRTDVADKEMKQISLFDPTEVKALKRFVYDSRKNDTKVGVSMEFVNTEKDGLGMPLPAGKVRVYKRDTDGGLEFVGEDAVDHTPKNEKVRLTLGSAFDLAAERKIVDTRRISQRVREDLIEISLRNRKSERVTVTAVEHFWGDWEISEKSHDFVKKDAYTAEFTIDIPPDSETKITYTVRIR